MGDEGRERVRRREQPANDARPVAVSDERLDQRILVIRGRRVLLDVDLARVYHVLPKRLNQQVKRNRARFPADFMFQLTPDETERVRLRSVTSKPGRGGRRYWPYAFTEHGAVMLATVLKSPVAIEASIHVVRAFVRLRAMVAVHKELVEKLDALETKYDGQFRIVFEAIRELMTPAPKPLGARIGFRTSDED
jgi:hypothetical protein